MTNNSYDVAIIKQIVARGGDDVIGRVINALVPGAPSTKETRQIARKVLETMFDAGEINCPRCGATMLDAENVCYGDADCPVAEI
ncbi:hypothetical protein LCGC14_1878750 [marine sediment metagenome]|uniref:Uncharacterized protein n=1 Tax=marine sediment metagenome TaxID=412755 RepID=A0A0F9G2Y0_9ZZZZ